MNGFKFSAEKLRLTRPDGSIRFLEPAGWSLLKSINDLGGPFNIDQMVSLAGTSNLAPYAMQYAGARVLIAQVRDAVAGFFLLEEIWDDKAHWTFAAAPRRRGDPAAAVAVADHLQLIGEKH